MYCNNRKKITVFKIIIRRVRGECNGFWLYEFYTIIITVFFQYNTSEENIRNLHDVIIKDTSSERQNNNI